MKRILTLILVAALVLSLVACGGGGAGDTNTPSGGNGDNTSTNTPSSENGDNTSTNTPSSENGDNISIPSGGGEDSTPEETIEPEVEKLSLGEKAETDFIGFSLDSAEFAIALENTFGTDFYSPKEYDPSTDSKNSLVAAKGHVLVAITYTVQSADELYIDFDPRFSFEYNGETYNPLGIVNGFYTIRYGLHSHDGTHWEAHNAANVLLSPGEKITLKGYCEIVVDPESLTDNFDVTVYLPSTSGTQIFIYSKS